MAASNAFTKCGVLVCGLLATTLATAEFPERRIQLIFPLTPGTPTYAVSQIIADAMGAELGKAMPVVAKPGAGGVNAVMAALAEPADGYTVIDAYVAPLVVAPLFGRATYTCKDFIPLYGATSTPLAVVSRPDEKRWTDFASFIQYLKANPGKTRYTGAAELALPHLAAAKMLQSIGAVGRHVPYNDLADGINDLRGGTLDWIIANPGMYIGNKEFMRVLAVMSESPDDGIVYGGAKRVKDFGFELGLSGLAPMPWDWWVVKQGTPDKEVATLRAAMAKALAKPEVRSKIANLGFVMTGYKPEQYSETCNRIRDELKSATDSIEWEKNELKKVQ